MDRGGLQHINKICQWLKKKNCPFTNVLSTMSYSKIYLNVTQITEYLSWNILDFK